MRLAFQEVRAAVIGAIVAVLLAAVPALTWLGALDNRLEQLENGGWIKQTRGVLMDELRDSIRVQVASALEAALNAPGVQSRAVFTDPAAGSRVDLREMARGTTGGTRPGSNLWVFVFSMDASRYFPQAQKADMQLQGEWASLVQIGQSNDYGKRFDLILTEADNIGAAAIAKYLDHHEYMGMVSLPAGTRPLARIPVVRKER